MNTKSVIALAVLVAITSAHAGELLIHTISVHSKENHQEASERPAPSEPGGLPLVYKTAEVKYNNRNFGLGWRFDSGYMVGAYQNSYNLTTVYLAKDFMLNEHVGLLAGMATGYQEMSGAAITPIGGILLKLPVADRVSLNILAMPRMKTMDGVIQATLSVKF